MISVLAKVFEKEKRREERREVELDVCVVYRRGENRETACFRTKTENVSRNGAAIRHGGKLTRGDEIELRIEGRAEYVRCRECSPYPVKKAVSAEVRWRTNGVCGVKGKDTE